MNNNLKIIQNYFSVHTFFAIYCLGLTIGAILLTSYCLKIHYIPTIGIYNLISILIAIAMLGTIVFMCLLAFGFFPGLILRSVLNQQDLQKDTKKKIVRYFLVPQIVCLSVFLLLDQWLVNFHPLILVGGIIFVSALSLFIMKLDNNIQVNIEIFLLFMVGSIIFFFLFGKLIITVERISIITPAITFLPKNIYLIAWVSLVVALCSCIASQNIPAIKMILVVFAAWFMVQPSYSISIYNNLVLKTMTLIGVYREHPNILFQEKGCKIIERRTGEKIKIQNELCEMNNMNILLSIGDDYLLEYNKSKVRPFTISKSYIDSIDT